MFRKVVDVVSKAKLPADDGANGPSKQARRVLKARLDWLLANGLLPAGIAELADCIREDGNDAVHEHPIGKDEAGDLADFTVQLLEGVYTQPGRLKAASERRAQRRKEKPTP